MELKVVISISVVSTKPEPPRGTREMLLITPVPVDGAVSDGLLTAAAG